MTEHTPKIYVACLASYNAGILHGDWIDLDGSETLEERISEILDASPEEDAEEWAVHDHEFCGHLSEYAGTDTLNAIQEAFEKVEAEAKKHVAAFPHLHVTSAEKGMGIGELRAALLADTGV